MDCKFLKSPTAGDISPPRFKLDKFLQKHERKKKIRISQKPKNDTPNERVRQVMEIV
jgi:hypothetical protein